MIINVQIMTSLDMKAHKEDSAVKVSVAETLADLAEVDLKTFSVHSSVVVQDNVILMRHVKVMIYNILWLLPLKKLFLVLKRNFY